MSFVISSFSFLSLYLPPFLLYPLIITCLRILICSYYILWCIFYISTTWFFLNLSRFSYWFVFCFAVLGINSDLMLARQALYHLSHSTCPCWVFLDFLILLFWFFFISLNILNNLYNLYKIYFCSLCFLLVLTYSSLFPYVVCNFRLCSHVQWLFIRILSGLTNKGLNVYLSRRISCC
jgi:hypothetical protein